jgi:hypothetical protein
MTSGLPTLARPRGEEILADLLGTAPTAHRDRSHPAACAALSSGGRFGTGEPQSDPTLAAVGGLPPPDRPVRGTDPANQ